MKIEKCPFCGCKAILCSTGNHFATEKFFVSCGVCGVETPRIARTRKEAIAAWNRRADHLPDTTKKVSNADRMRSMTDEELATWILENINCDKENIMCIPALYKNSDKCDGRCRDGRLSWLKQPVKEE